MDLWTAGCAGSRLTAPARSAAAHKLHSAQAIILQIRESQNISPVPALAYSTPVAVQATLTNAVGHLELVGASCLELTVGPVEWARSALLRDRRAAAAPTHHPLQAQRTHQALYGAAGDAEGFRPQLPPHLACAVDAEVLRVHATDFRHQGLITLHLRRHSFRIGLPGAHNTSTGRYATAHRSARPPARHEGRR